ncbi:DUF6708 domain-containing protein [Pseudomonas sp. NPDC089752]|uniref:DUF6708 domain-containing protein n=1 Tax=Pseudomonas sp. NPDC089752 TaxID=3364472 RepID=UPI0037F55A87
MTRPLLDPPCVGWREDLSLPNETPNTTPSLGGMTPNHIDSIYLEISRQTAILRNLYFLIVIGVALTGPPILIILAESLSSQHIGISAVFFSLLLNYIWCLTYGLKLSALPPRDEPIRFNRARKKIYAYNYIYCWWNPFEKTRVTPTSYDWLQVRAERWAQSGALPDGGLIFKCGVVLSIIRPGTTEVIDRFHLTTMGADEHAWSYICTYMQEGPSALPPPGEPKDHNDVLWCEFASRLAPKVAWPSEMDLESRSAKEADLSNA